MGIDLQSFRKAFSEAAPYFANLEIMKQIVENLTEQPNTPSSIDKILQNMREQIEESSDTTLRTDLKILEMKFQDQKANKNI